MLRTPSPQAQSDAVVLRNDSPPQQTTPSRLSNQSITRHDAGLSSALLKWVQTFSTQPRPQKLDDLNDGHILWQILHDIDSDYFPENGLPASTSDTNITSPGGVNGGQKWIARWQNLKVIDRAVRGYVRDICGVMISDNDADYESGQDQNENKTRADLKRIAQASKLGEAEDDVVILLKEILRAAMYSPTSNQRIAKVVVGLGAEVAGIIAAAIASMEEEQIDESNTETEAEHTDEVIHEFSSDDAKTANKGKSNERDIDLAHEEQLISAHRRIRELTEANNGYVSELTSSRSKVEQLETEMKNMESTYASSTSSTAVIQSLREQSESDKTYIAELETSLTTTQDQLTSNERTIKGLRSETNIIQGLKDELQILRAERDDLLTRSRTNENLRKKIANLQDVEKQSSLLREELQIIKAKNVDSEKWKDRCEKAEKSARESMGIIANTEQEIFEQKTLRRTLEAEIRTLEGRVDQYKERAERDRDVIADLEGKAMSAREGGGGLEREIEDLEKRDKKEDTTMDQRDESSQNIQISSGATSEMLEERIKSLVSRNKLLEEQYLDILTSKIGYDTSEDDRMVERSSNKFTGQQNEVKTEDEEKSIFKLLQHVHSVTRSQDNHDTPENNVREEMLLENIAKRISDRIAMIKFQVYESTQEVSSFLTCIVSITNVLYVDFASKRRGNLSTPRQSQRVRNVIFFIW